MNYTDLMFERDRRLDKFLQCTDLKNILEIGQVIVDIYDNGGKIIGAANGGGANCIGHFGSEMMGRYQKSRNSLPFINLCNDAATITCLSNDYSFDDVFARQLGAVYKTGDLFIGYSGSGNSKNIKNCFDYLYKENSLFVGGKGICKGKYNIILDVETELSQEFFLSYIHMWCKMIDENYE